MEKLMVLPVLLQADFIKEARKRGSKLIFERYGESFPGNGHWLAFVTNVAGEKFMLVMQRRVRRRRIKSADGICSIAAQCGHKSFEVPFIAIDSEEGGPEAGF